MKKTIAALAMIASSNAVAIIGPHDPAGPQPKVSKVCLNVSSYKDNGKVISYASCDETLNNKEENRPLLANGCAEGQVALSFLGESTIESCMPPGLVQL